MDSKEEHKPVSSSESNLHPALPPLPPIPDPVIPPEPAIIVMPLDSSEHSEYAIQYYIKYIHRPINKVYPIYVAEDYLKRPKKESIAVDPATGERVKDTRCCAFLRVNKDSYRVVVDVGPSPGVLAELEHQDRLNCHRVKSRVRELFHANDVHYDFRRLTGPDPWTTIITFRKEIGGTIIIMGSRGLGAIKRSIFGSVSDKVLHNSLVPVLVVKKPSGAMESSEANKDTVIH